MKKGILLIAIAITTLNSCEEKSTSEKFKDAVESAGEDVKNATEEAGEKTEKGFNKLKKKLSD